MSAVRPYRVLLVGAAADGSYLEVARNASSGSFEFELSDPESLAREPEATSERLYDVVIVGATVERPLPLAQLMRSLWPKSQIIILLRADRLDRFRAGLPFVPNLASAWTASIADPAIEFSRLIGEAGRVAREKVAAAAVLGRINAQLTSRKDAPAQLRRSQLAMSERYLATILTQSPDAFLAVDPAGNVTAFNEAAVGLLGPALEDPACRVESLFSEEDWSRLQQCLADAGSGLVSSGIEARLDRAGGDRCDVELSLAPVRDESGSIVSVSITARDITERKRAEDRQRLLVNELNHRVKNTLAIVQALAQQSLKGIASPEEERAAFNARLATLAAAHNLLTRETWEPVSLAKIIDTTAGVACGASSDRYRVEGPDVLLKPQTAVSIAIAIHELCTNAIKYGALSNERGSIAVRWAIGESEQGSQLHLEWTETGGPQVEPPARRGFGSRMIERGLANELNGQVRMEFRREGLRCVIDAPLPAIEP